MSYWQILVCLVFLWVGFVSAISFMEAWLKFRAPGVTLPIGLSIGRLIFNALNKVEWAFALVSLVVLYFGRGDYANEAALLLLSVLILLLQTIWLLPAMDKRAAMTIAGVDLPRSTLHFYYIGAELAKVIALVAFGSYLFN